MSKEYDKVLNVSLKNEKQCETVFKALSNKTRREILRLLARKGPLSIQNISFNLDIPMSTISEHIAILLKSKVVSYLRKNNERGQSKIIFRQFEKIDVNINEWPKVSQNKENKIIEVPIGSYASFNIHDLCGMICNDGYVGFRDNKTCFYESDRFKAQLIWFDYGYLEYKVPIGVNPSNEISSLSISLELCSEAPGYNEEWKSDISFAINDIDVGYFTSPGDFGARPGKLTPKWWVDCTSYGLLKTLEVKSDGTYIDGNKISDVSIKDIKVNENPVLTFRVGVKEKAKNRGGLNIFGDSFGDYNQHIVITLSYK